MQEAKFMTPRELVARYKNRVTERTLANWRSTGQGPRFVKIGGRVMYPINRVAEWENERESRLAK